jgi:hypothetical protein
MPAAAGSDHRIQFPPISIIGFGRRSDPSLVRVLRPPAKIKLFIGGTVVCVEIAPILELSNSDCDLETRPMR